MENFIWFDVIAFQDGARDIVFSTRDKVEAFNKAKRIAENDNTVGVVIKENMMKNNTYKLLGKTIINETEAVKKHYAFLKSIEDGLMKRGN